MDPMTIGMLVLAGLAALSHVRDIFQAWRAGKQPPAPSPLLDTFTHGVLQSVLDAARNGKLTADHPLLSVLQAALQGVTVVK